VKTHAAAKFKNLSHDQVVYDSAPIGPPLSRITIRREFQGDLTGESVAELQACASAKDQFCYVGTDRFTGKLKGRSGSFVFQHGGEHELGKWRPFGYIVLGSGTGELDGIHGEIKITVTPEGEHTIELDYE
jgi:hypothetical protein